MAPLGLAVGALGFAALRLGAYVAFPTNLPTAGSVTSPFMFLAAAITSALLIVVTTRCARTGTLERALLVVALLAAGGALFGMFVVRQALGYECRVGVAASCAALIRDGVTRPAADLRRTGCLKGRPNGMTTFELCVDAVAGGELRPEDLCEAGSYRAMFCPPGLDCGSDTADHCVPDLSDEILCGAEAYPGSPRNPRGIPPRYWHGAVVSACIRLRDGGMPVEAICNRVGRSSASAAVYFAFDCGPTSSHR